MTTTKGLRLTHGEGWWLRRRRTGETQVALATAMGVSEDRVGDWEKDRGAVPAPTGWAKFGRAGPTLTVGEFLALARRRKGWTVARAARFFRVSRQTYLKAEADGTSSAVRFARRFRAGGLPGPVAASPLRAIPPDLRE